MRDPIERRYQALEQIEIRGEGKETKISGYAAVFNVLSEDLGGFREQIAPGAFSKALGGDVRALFNHDSSHILGRTRSKTLVLSEDQRGLRVEITPPDTPFANHVVEAIRRGDISQMSFGFTVNREGQKWDEIDGKIVRTLTNVSLFDVSPVTFPAYPQTEVAVRALDAWRKEAEPPKQEDFSSRMKLRQQTAEI